MGTRAYFHQNEEYNAQDLRAFTESIVLSDGVAWGLSVAQSGSHLVVQPGMAFETISASATGQRFMMNLSAATSATNVSGGSNIWSPAGGGIFRKDIVFMSLDDEQLGGSDEVKVQFILGANNDNNPPTTPGSTDNRPLAQVYSSNGGSITVTDLRTPVTLPGTDPVGTIQQYGATGAPFGWLPCDGSEVSRSTYSGLFGVIGTSFGNGDGSNTFTLPDFRGRSPIGVGQGQGLSARSIAGTGGAETHVLGIDEMPNHRHTHAHTHGLSLQGDGSHQHLPAPGWGIIINTAAGVQNNGGLGLVAGGQRQTDAGYMQAAGTHYHSGSSTNSQSDSNTSYSPNHTAYAHNNMQPYLTVNFIIKAG